MYDSQCKILISTYTVHYGPQSKCTCNFVSGNMRFSGIKIHCSPRDQSLSVYYLLYKSHSFNFQRISFINIILNCYFSISDFTHTVGLFKCMLGLFQRQVQKSDRINSDRQSESDRPGLTRIDSDRLRSCKKHKMK